MTQLKQSLSESSDFMEKLNVIIRLLSASLTQGQNKTEAIVTLGRLRLSAAEIADIVGVSAHHVRQTLYMERKKISKRNSSSDTTEDSHSEETTQ